MYDTGELKERAAKAVDKKAAIGPDVDLDEFETVPLPTNTFRTRNCVRSPRSNGSGCSCPEWM